MHRSIARGGIAAGVLVVINVDLDEPVQRIRAERERLVWEPVEPERTGRIDQTVENHVDANQVRADVRDRVPGVGIGAGRCRLPRRDVDVLHVREALRRVRQIRVVDQVREHLAAVAGVRPPDLRVVLRVLELSSVAREGGSDQERACKRRSENPEMGAPRPHRLATSTTYRSSPYRSILYRMLLLCMPISLAARETLPRVKRRACMMSSFSTSAAL